MKNVKTLFNCGIDVEIKGIKINSKEVEPGDLFIARHGVNSDGHDFIDEATKKGAVCVLVSKNVNCNVPKILVDDVNSSIPEVMDWYYGNLNDKFNNIIGVTGTAGKTTMCNIINTIISYVSTSGLIGTNGIVSKDYTVSEFKTLNTTVNVDKLYEIANIFYKNKVKNLVLETSSYGLKYNRLGNVDLDVGVVTNFSSAHTNEHESNEDYLESKLKIINKLKNNGKLVLNYDDPVYNTFKSRCSKEVYSYGSNDICDLYFYDVKEQLMAHHLK